MRSANPIAVAVAAAAFGCAGPTPAPSGPPLLPAGASAPLPPARPLAPASPWRVDGATAARLVRSGARLVDVRSPEEFQKGHLPGALLLGHDQVESRARELGPPSTPVVVYSSAGRRSREAAGTLRRLGYGQAWDLGPMSAWPAAGR
jgi:phage shock protein E